MARMSPGPYSRVQEMACFCRICKPLDDHIECNRFTEAEIVAARLRGKLQKRRNERQHGKT